MANAADELFHPTASQSIWKVTRQLKKEQSSLYNCVASVLSDAAFVSEVRSLYPSLPLLANLRCGLWYTRQADGTCYFKSTDGHNGNWSFSSTRLNWNVCELAAKQGGVIIVDATRKGKRFPDAMAKTIPIWAAVVNRAIARKRAEPSARMAAAEAASAAAAPEVLDRAAAAERHQEPRAELTVEGCYESGALGPAPPGVPIAASQLRTGRHDRSGSDGGSPTMPPPPQCTWAAWSVTDGDLNGGSSCARVGSLSQWLQSPVAAAANEDEVKAGALSQCPMTHRPLHGSRGADWPATAAPPLPSLRSGCGVPAPGSGCEVEEVAEVESPADMEMYAMELHEEASFGEVAEMSPDGDQSPSLQPLVADTGCDDRPAAAAPERTGDSPCLSDGVITVPCCDGVGPEAPTTSTARLFFSPFAVAAPTATAPVLHEAADKSFAIVLPTSTRSDTGVTSPSLTPESSDSVDLGAASASHVSCSPEEGWRWGGLFGVVVNHSDEPLRLCCTCDSRECSSSELLLRQQQRRCSVATDAADPDACGGGGPCPQRTPRVPQELDVDPDGSGGSCSDTCGPAGLSGLTSTRASSSSSSSSGYVSRRSSCSSGHSDFVSQARPGAGAGRPACPSGEPAPRLRPFPRHHTCSPSAPPPWSPRRCSSVTSRAAAACGGAGNSTRNDGCTFAVAHSGGGSSAGGAAAADEPTPLVASSGCCAGATCACVDGGECWDVGLHLPLWISSNERAQIERRLDGWVDALLRVGADVEGLAKVLRKPLRPLWISQSSTIWVDQVAQPDQLPFTPLYLVSASQPHAYLRQAACVGGGGGASDADGDSGDGRGAAQGRHPHRKRPGQVHGHRHHDQQQPQPHAWTYMYLPGAGDDEESWAVGLTPAVFWAHYTELLQAGPAGVHDAVRQVLQREAAALAEHGTNSSILAAAAAATHGSVAGAYAAPTDAHHLMPAGCCGGDSAAAAAAAGIAAPGPGGMYLIGPTCIALGDLAAGAAPACWSQVDAVLCCGPHQHPSMAREPQWPRGELPPRPEEGTGSGPGHGQAHGGVEAGAVEQVLAAAVEAKGSGDGCGSAKEGEERGAAIANDGEGAGSLVGADVEQQQQQQRHHHHYHRLHQYHQQGRPWRHRPAPRYLHLPVQHYKHHRTSLLQHLGPALEFLSHHLSRGHRVLIHDTNGLDTCVCVAVALLLACYGPCGSNGGEAGAPVWARPYRAGGGDVAEELALEAVSKDAVRQRLAYVSGFYPPARPTRGMLRQVFNHFVSAKGDGGKAGGGGGAAGLAEEVGE